MTREEAVKQIERLLFEHCEAMMTSDEPVWSQDCEALKVALFALRGPTREQVEKVWRSEWNQDEHGRVVCNRCGSIAAIGTENALHNAKKYDRFCFYCGAPMTDKAVEMVMERLEALHSETKTD